MTSTHNENFLLKYSSWACLISVIALLVIWVLPNTIALRHLLMASGVISSLIIIFKTHFFRNRRVSDLLPLALIASLFIWAIIHFYFFSLNPVIERQELTSIWARSLTVSMIAIGLSISLRLYEQLRPYFFISLFVVSTINLGAYLYLSYVNGAFILPIVFVEAFVFKKIEAAFFGVISISIACANLVYLSSKRFDQQTFITIFFWFLGIALALISAVVANTKNGVAVSLGLCLLLLLIYIYSALFHKNERKGGLFIPVVFMAILLFGGWKVHTHFAAKGWETLIEDIKISSRIDQHNFWRYSSNHWNKVVTETFPVNSNGASVAGNTYLRIAWATQGIKLIAQYPMGYGSINRSFVGLLNQAQIQHELESQSHSGWIDFGLAFGIPGLIILLAIFACTFWYGIKNGAQFGCMAVWLILGLIPFGVVAEISYKHNFEILIFFISFAAASVCSKHKEK